MAIYTNGKNIHPFINGKRIGTIYRGGSKVYQDYTKVGTVLGTWGDSNTNGLDNNVTLNLSGKISKLKNGIILTYDSWYENDQVVGSAYYSQTNSGRTVSILKSNLKIGTTYMLPVTGENLAANNLMNSQVVLLMNSDTQLVIYTSMYYIPDLYNLRIYPRKMVAY